MSELPTPTAPLLPPELLDVASLGRTLLLIPHPDDEVIGCGGLLMELAACQVILVSDGSGAGALPEGTDAIRQDEFRAAMQILNPDAELLLWRVPDGGLAEAEHLAGDISDAVQQFGADTVVAPWYRDMHSDHNVLGHIALSLLRKPLCKQLLFYETWSPLDANRILDITAEWPRKLAALQCHATALQAQYYDSAMAGLAQHRALLLPGISRAQPQRYAEAYHLQLAPDRNRRRFHAREATASDGPAIQALFKAVFETDVDQQWWQWKYLSRDWIGTVAFSDKGRLAGFYGVVDGRAWWQGEVLSICQLVDSMVRKSSRGSSRRSGAFVEMCQHFLAPNVGDGKAFALAYGFPTERAMRAGETLGVYQRGEATALWSRPARAWGKQDGPGRPWSTLLWRSELLRPDSDQAVDQTLKEVDRLFPLMREALPDTLLRERSADYWNWRFARHPSVAYEFLVIRRLGNVVAIGVLRQRGEPGEPGSSLELVDAVFDRPGAFQALLKCAEHRAWQRELARFSVWGTRRLLADLPDGDTVDEGWVAWPDAQFNAGLVNDIKGHFWAMGGDTDFR